MIKLFFWGVVLGLRALRGSISPGSGVPSHSILIFLDPHHPLPHPPHSPHLQSSSSSSSSFSSSLLLILLIIFIILILIKSRSSGGLHLTPPRPAFVHPITHGARKQLICRKGSNFFLSRAHVDEPIHCPWGFSTNQGLVTLKSIVSVHSPCVFISKTRDDKLMPG